MKLGKLLVLLSAFSNARTALRGIGDVHFGAPLLLCY